MKKKILMIMICSCLVLGVSGCNINNLIGDKNDVSYSDLSEVNNKIIEYFSSGGINKYDNYSYNYVDVENMVVVVGLLDNSKEKQEEFRRLVIDSNLIKFIKGEKLENS